MNEPPKHARIEPGHRALVASVAPGGRVAELVRRRQTRLGFLRALSVSVVIFSPLRHRDHREVCRSVVTGADLFRMFGDLRGFIPSAVSKAVVTAFLVDLRYQDGSDFTADVDELR